MPKTVPKPKRRTPLQNEERFRTLIEQSTDAIQLLDGQGRIIYSSDSVKNVLGYTPAEIEKADPADHVHPDDLPAFTKKIQKMLTKPGGRVDALYRVRHKNGSWVWVETVAVNHLDNPAIEAVVGNFRNVTRRIEAEEALKKSEERLRFLAESMPQKIFTAGPDGIINYFNPQWSEYTGLSMEQINRLTFEHFIHPDDRQANMEAWQDAVTTAEPYEFEQRFRDAEGNYRWHLTRARAMRDEAGGVVAWIGSSTDIDDIRQARAREQRLQHQAALLTEQRQQLLELNRAKDEFISLASHQLRTPATGVKQYLGMILEGYAGDELIPPQVQRMVEVAYESNERQLKIVNDLLKVAYVDAGRIKLIKSDCDVQELIEGAVKDLQEVFSRRSQQVVCTNAVPDAIVQADCRLVRMVLENLIDNASKYSPEKSTVTIAVERAAGFLCIDITDQGVGISPEDHTKLFKKFSRIDNAMSTQVGGTGLGLYWAQQIIALHRGSIMVRSKAGEGSTFTVQLPL